ncbi:hypothetical protein V7087_17570 [Neobacillus niacini]|uniref:hypothetical protein n=1 Tax=Neobacillus niacini TaxID=86668 RepID=UPI002FFF73D9
MSRKIDDKGIEIIVPYSTGKPNGKAKGVDNNQDAFVIFRVYVDKKALVGPALFDVIWDRAVLFTKKNSREKVTCKDIIIKLASMEIRL